MVNIDDPNLSKDDVDTITAESLKTRKQMNFGPQRIIPEGTFTMYDRQGRPHTVLRSQVGHAQTIMGYSFTQFRPAIPVEFATLNIPDSIANNTLFRPDQVVMSLDDGTALDWQTVLGVVNGLTAEYGGIPRDDDSAIRWDNGMSESDWGDGSWQDAIRNALATTTAETEPFDPDLLGLGGSGGGGGGGGGGGRAAVPRPDRRAIRDQVKSYVVATTGTVNNDLIDAGVAKYFAEFAKMVKTKKTQIDPWQGVFATVRSSQPYKLVHHLRPESVDEMEWVTSRQQKLQSIGISAERAEGLGITAAQGGASDEGLAMIGDVAQSRNTARHTNIHRERLKAAGRAAGGLV